MTAHLCEGPRGVSQVARADGHEAADVQAEVAATLDHRVDLLGSATALLLCAADVDLDQHRGTRRAARDLRAEGQAVDRLPEVHAGRDEIGRAAGRGRVCQYG